MIRKNYYAIARACGGNSPTLIKCNFLAGYRVQPAPTRLDARRIYIDYRKINKIIIKKSLFSISN